MHSRIPRNKNTKILLAAGNYVWQEFVAKYLSLHLITIDNQRMESDLRNRTDLFVRLMNTLRMRPDNCACYEEMTTVFAVVLNSGIPFHEYTMPTDCGEKLPRLIKTLHDDQYQHFVVEADYTASAEYTVTLGYYACALMMIAKEHPVNIFCRNE